MNTKTIFTFILLLSLSFLKFTNPVEQTNPLLPGPNTPEGRFLIGSLHSMRDINTQHYQDGRFNLTHVYTNTEAPGSFPKDPGRNTPSTNITGITEYLYSPVNTSGIQQTLNNVHSRNGSRVFWQRPKIEWLVYGQSSTYKAFQDNPDYYFYSFNDLSGQRYPDWSYNGGKDVLYCSQPNLGPGARVVLSRLKSNAEQSRGGYTDEYNQWHGDNQCTWYVKPRIRANRNFIINPANAEVDICKIYVIMENGLTQKVLSPETIKAKHFQKNYDYENLYSGGYLEEFYFDGQSSPPRGVTFPGALGGAFGYESWWYAARGECLTDPVDLKNKADIKIEWLNNCEMWLDYVKVENDVANRLLKGNDPDFEQWILDEVNAVKDPPPGTTEPVVYNFYIELFEFNNIPCMAYVNQKIQQYSGGKIGFMADLLVSYQSHLPWRERGGNMISPQKLKSMFYDVTNFDQVFIGDPYPITANQPQDCGGTGQYSLIPNTMGVTPNGYSMFKLAAPNDYDAWLQGLLDTTCIFYEGGSEPPGEHSFLIGDFRYLMQHGNEVSNVSNKPFIAMLQAHQWNKYGEVDREPTNEEQNLMTNEAVSYGAKGIIFWGWDSWHDQIDPSCIYTLGIVGEDGSPRPRNVYNQLKWDEFKKITERLEKWGPTLMKFKNDEIRSYIYRYPEQRSQIWGCVKDVYTYIPNCPETDYNNTPEPENNRFIQLATFDELGWTSDVNERHFIIVNKRCSPHTQTDCGGLRRVKVKLGDFNFPATSGFLRFRNLNLIDVETGNIVATFDKHQNNSYPIIDLGWFEPGEGKLYKIVPTLLSGGTLVADEDLNLTPSQYHVNNYDVTGTVYSNGHLVVFDNPMTLNFAENTGWVLENSFVRLGDDSDYGIMQGKDGAKWNGISVINCSVFISKALVYKDIKDGNYAVNLTNPSFAEFYYCTFDNNSGNSISGGININSNLSSNPMHLVTNCNFNMGQSNMQGINIISSPFASRIIFDYVNINRTYASSSIGIFLDGCTGTIKNSYINQPFQDLIAVNSNLDLYRNQFYSSEPVYGTAYSYINMAPSINILLAGNNTIGNGYRNLIVLNSRFNLFNGGNSFNVATANDKHLLGYFPLDDDISGIDVSGNCFYVNSSATNPLHYITMGSGGQQLNVLYSGGNNCFIQQGDVAFILNPNSGEYSDTVFYTNMQNLQVGPAVVLLQNISINSRKKQYDSVVTQATYYLTNFADSLGSTEAVEELFYATIEIDENGSKISQLKTKYEELILNNPENINLCNMLYYYIQKCKVALGEFNSALSGLQQIINQNPYSYEGLIASWDFMSAYLLDSSGGSGGEAGDIKKNGDDIKIRDDFDKDRFNEDQRNSIKQSIINVLQSTKKDQDDEVIILKQKETEGDKEAGQKLKIKQALNDAVKVKRPRDESEYVKFVENDIKKVFGVGETRNDPSNNNSNIPRVFKLSQNYPNPFNPVTKINYDLPKDSKVKIIIYDILGREVKRLVNNELKTAGSYIVDFNAMNYASGVYFYRIEAEEPNGNKFVDSKKMVLLK